MQWTVQLCKNSIFVQGVAKILNTNKKLCFFIWTIFLICCYSFTTSFITVIKFFYFKIIPDIKKIQWISSMFLWHYRSLKNKIVFKKIMKIIDITETVTDTLKNIIFSSHHKYEFSIYRLQFVLRNDILTKWLHCWKFGII